MHLSFACHKVSHYSYTLSTNFFSLPEESQFTVDVSQIVHNVLADIIRIAIMLSNMQGYPVIDSANVLDSIGIALS